MKLLYFAWFREKIGHSQEQINLPDNVQTVTQLIDHLKTRSPGHAAAFADLAVVRVALDQEYANHDAPLGQAQEAAFFPPVTGG